MSEDDGMNASAAESTTPTTVPDVLDAAAGLVAGGMDVEAAINSAVHGAPETRTGSPLTAAAKSALIRGIDEELLPEWPITSPGSVFRDWIGQVGPDEVVATMRRVAEEVRTAERPLPE